MRLRYYYYHYRCVYCRVTDPPNPDNMFISPRARLTGRRDSSAAACDWACSTYEIVDVHSYVHTFEQLRYIM